MQLKLLLALPLNTEGWRSYVLKRIDRLSGEAVNFIAKAKKSKKYRRICYTPLVVIFPFLCLIVQDIDLSPRAYLKLAKDCLDLRRSWRDKLLNRL